jgi:putative flippase GtrA
VIDVLQTLRYSAVSGLCLLLHNVVIISADSAGWPLSGAVLLSFCLSASAGYLLHSLFTFSKPVQMHRFSRYLLAVSANIPLAYVTVWFWHKLVGLEMLWASPIASICMVGINFVLARWAILPRFDQVA